MLLNSLYDIFGSLYAYLLTTNGILVSICIVLLTAAILRKHRSLFSGPGPWGVPLLGYYPFLKKDMHIQLHEMTKKYGPVYKLNICGETFVYMGNIAAIKESHITKAEDFPHRIDRPSLFTDMFKEGIFIVKGEHWKVMRKFIGQSLREIGLSTNKDDQQDQIESAVKFTLDSLARSKGEPVDITALLIEGATRAVLRPYLGEDVRQEDIRDIVESYFDTFVPFVDRSILLYGDFARKFVMPWIDGYSRYRKGVTQMSSILYRIVKEHKARFDPELHPNNFIDAYLKEKSIREKKGDPTAKYFTDECLLRTLMQIYGDGATGVGLFIASYVFELSKRQEVEDAIYEEIVKVVGTERLPTLEDRVHIPFTNSTIKELFRNLILFPILPGLECVRDTVVQGVSVPKGSIVILNYWAVHNDPATYENPEVFDATRFMPNKPKVDPPITFGVGKRSCAGEGVVMAELFMFMTAIFQNFKLITEAHLEGTVSHSAEGKCLVRAVPRPQGLYHSTGP